MESRADGNKLVQALLDKLANGYVGAEGTANGNPRIKAGTKVQISGVGSKFSGTYRVATASHILRTGAPYMTWFSSSPTHTILSAVGEHNNGNGSDAPLFATHVGGAVFGLERQQYVVAPDGQRFLMSVVPEDPNPPPITVILNWRPRPQS